jgi:hypothetical protein
MRYPSPLISGGGRMMPPVAYLATFSAVSTSIPPPVPFAWPFKPSSWAILEQGRKSEFEPAWSSPNVTHKRQSDGFRTLAALSSQICKEPGSVDAC